MSDGGSRSGGRRAEIANLPEPQQFKILESFPSLEGSEKQVKWAEEIRSKAAEEMGTYALFTTSGGKRMNLIQTAVKGKSAIRKSIEENPLVKSTTGALRKQKIDNAVSAYEDLADRIGRFNKVFSNTSAKFWIENRPNQTGNFRYEKFKKTIDGR